MSNTYAIRDQYEQYLITDTNNNGSYDPEDDVETPDCLAGGCRPLFAQRNFEKLAQTSGYDLNNQSYELTQLALGLNWKDVQNVAKQGDFEQTGQRLIEIEQFAWNHQREFDVEKAVDLLMESAWNCIEKYPPRLENYYYNCVESERFGNLKNTLRSASRYLGLSFDSDKWDSLQKSARESNEACW